MWFTSISHIPTWFLYEEKKLRHQVNNKKKISLTKNTFSFMLILCREFIRYDACVRVAFSFKSFSIFNLFCKTIFSYINARFWWCRNFSLGVIRVSYTFYFAWINTKMQFIFLEHNFSINNSLSTSTKVFTASSPSMIFVRHYFLFICNR